MSDAAFAPHLFGPSTGFRIDPRFGFAEVLADNEDSQDDPVAIARAEGYAQGLADAGSEAVARAEADDAAREALALSFVRLDREHEEDLRTRLRDTVIALCEATLAPAAIDPEALSARVTRAAALLARADDERVIRLHPEDVALVAPRLAADWNIVPDPALERGAVRVEAANGGIEDGPAQWRRALAEALAQC